MRIKNKNVRLSYFAWRWTPQTATVVIRDQMLLQMY